MYACCDLSSFLQINKFKKKILTKWSTESVKYKTNKTKCTLNEWLFSFCFLNHTFRKMQTKIRKKHTTHPIVFKPYTKTYNFPIGINDHKFIWNLISDHKQNMLLSTLDYLMCALSFNCSTDEWRENQWNFIAMEEQFNLIKFPITCFHFWDCSQDCSKEKTNKKRSCSSEHIHLLVG